MIKISFLMLVSTFCLLNSLPRLAMGQDSFQEVIVSPGDTMWNIANKYLKDPQKWPEIVKINNFPTSDPTIALPGSRIKIPVNLIKEEYRTAQLIHVIPEVRYKRRDDADFKVASRDMMLRYEDSLRTMKGAQAKVRFPSKEIVQINENSYVVLKPEKIMQEIQLLQGDVRASRAKVIMPGGTVVKPNSNASEYQAKIREDESEVVFVYKGEVNVTAKGKTVRVKEGFGTHVPKSAPPIEPIPLSNFKDYTPPEIKNEPPPAIKTQAANKPIKFTPPAPTTSIAQITTGKSKAVVADNILVNYRVQIAKEEKFTNIILEKTEATASAFDISKQSIPDGRYYMRVAFIDALGGQAPYSAPTVVIKDTSPPELVEIKPAEGQTFSGSEPTCDVSGFAKGAVLVSVNGQVVFLSPNGYFNSTTYLKAGTNQIKVVARDANGNETVVTRRVNYSKN